MADLIETLARAIRGARKMSLCSLCDGVHRGHINCSCEELAQAVLAALQAAGMVVVPAEPTPEMCEAFYRFACANAAPDPNDFTPVITKAYRAMLSACGVGKVGKESV